jgi:uncharacterized glyoxalase superfamily protein PhnB
MTDPLDALREPLRPIDPDPAFAARLRARLERAVLAPQLAPPLASQFAPQEDHVTATVSTRPPGRAEALPLHTVTPYLAVTDARAAVEFYVAAFGAVPRGEPIVMPDGRIGHVEIALGESVVMMADEYPELGLLAPATRGGATQSLYLQVADPDAVVAHAVALGATLERPVTDQPYGRGGVVRDESGHRWMVTGEPVTARPGDVVYASLWTPDAAAAARFYAAVLGFTPDLDGGHEHPTTMLCYAVADLDAAVARVRAAGGTATDPEDRPYGRVADAVDDQGVPFALHQGEGGPAGQIDSVELRVADATRARAFYGTVLGWGFEPEAAPDCWRVRSSDGGDPRPAAHLTGSAPRAVVVPSFPVDDLEATLAAVDAAGGARRLAGEGAAECTDDQGAPFLLRQR